ncbi:MAG TPA: preprotein translocase subunit SecG [Candidatus Binataceae bacterium]|nr:preprotein translocase subunit SecG [Candidatus Binataceae bacterium]
MYVSAVIAIHITVCVVLVVIILLQQGKGADVGAVFGGSSSTVFGSSGAGNAMTRATWALATVFFATSIFLAYASTQRATGSIFSGSSTQRRSVMPAAPAGNVAVPAAPAAAGQAPQPAPQQK